MIKGDREIPVAPNNKPPSGCPNHGLESIEQCGGPTNSSVCLEFCRLGKDENGILTQDMATNRSIPEGLEGTWNNLSPQMRARIKAFGFTTGNHQLNSSDFTSEQWNNLSTQIRGRLISSKSMRDETSGS